MWTIYGVLLAGIWTFTSVVVAGIQVPNKWKQVVENGYQESGQNYLYPPMNQQLEYKPGLFPSDNIQYSPLTPLAVGKLYIGDSSKPSALNHNAFSANIKNPKIGLSAFSQYLKHDKSQEGLSSANTKQETQQNTLPPLRNPRYPIGQNADNLYHRSDYVSPNRLKYLESLNGHGLKNEENIPDNVLKIKPSVTDDNKSKQSGKALSQFAQVFNPEVFKGHSQISPSLYNLYLPNAQYQPSLKQALNQHIPQPHKFIVSASEADSNSSPLDFQIESNRKTEESTTTKEPVFFVTEGYRNVLVQGPNKKKSYIEPQIQKKGSKKVFREHKLHHDHEDDIEGDEEDEEGDEAETIPKQNKVSKTYATKGGKGNEDSVEGFSRNSLNSNWKKPTGFYDRPFKYFDEGKRSSLGNQQKTDYRDDILHEPENDTDFDREDDDDERLTEDDDDDDDDDGSIEENTKESEDRENVLISKKPQLTINNDATKENIKSSETTREEEENDEEPSDEESDGEENEETEQEDDKELKLIDNEHAEPKPIPTKPIYPGQGLWAKPGLKHTPHVTQHRFLKPLEDEQKPDGYDVFEDLEKFFQKQKVNFGDAVNQNAPLTLPLNTQRQPQLAPAIRLPNSPNPLVVYDPFNEGSGKFFKKIQQPIYQHESAPIHRAQEFEASRQPSNTQEDSTSEFVPSRLYAQVRKSENVAHEPRNPAEHGRLKEVIKDSKVQTVYSEEGYEDAAYDHAGHEKKAEEDKAYSQIQRAKQRRGEVDQSSTKKHDSDAGGSRLQPVVSEPSLGVPSDSFTSESEYLSPEQIKELMNSSFTSPNNESVKTENFNNFISTKETKTTQVKDKDNGDLQLEIESEIKVIMQPNNSTKAHKFVKIYPKVLKDISLESYDTLDEHNEDFDHDENDDNENVNNYLTLTEYGNEANEDDGYKHLSSKNVNNTLNDSESLLNPKELGNKVNNTLNKLTENKEAVHVFDEIFPSTTESSTVSGIEAMTRESSINETNKDKAFPEDSRHALEGSPEINLNRTKRSSGSYEDVEIDTDFIDKINHTFAPAVEERLDLVKYPYYQMSGINKDSPLRYAETTKNIPVKQAGELSFYNMADQFPCPDLPEDIEPIPERVQNAKTNEDIEESEEDDEDDDESIVDKKQPKKVRIELGDKIDCLKLRYFGENPLDNPIFKETTVSPVRSIFKELDRKPRQMQHSKSTDNTFNPSEVYEQINEIFNYNKDDDEFEFGLKDKIFSFISTPAIEPAETLPKTSSQKQSASSSSISNSNLVQSKKADPLESITTPNSLISLITTPKYTIQLTPNNIYDQIKLLDHLPGEAEYVTGKVEYTTAATAQDRIDEPQESISPNIEIVQTVERSEKNQKPKQRDARVLKNGDDSVTVPSIKVESETTNVLEPEAWRRQRVGNKRPPLFQIFDVNKFLTTTPFSIINTASTTVLPKHKVMSEVFYKEEIKPSEQLTVFADILNNIKNSTSKGKVPMQSSSNFAEPSSVTISSIEDPSVAPTQEIGRIKPRVKKFQTDSSSSQNIFNDSRSKYKSPPRRPFRQQLTNNLQSSSNHQPNIGKRPSAHKGTQNNVEYDIPNFSYEIDDLIFQSTLRPIAKQGIRKVLKRRRKPTTSTTTTTSTSTTTTRTTPKAHLAGNHKPYVIDYIEDVEQVIGLVPPQNSKYRTIIFDDSEVGDSNKVADQIYDYEGVVPSTAREPTIAKQPAPVTEVFEDVSTPRQLNKYYFLGLKPPANQRAMSYSEFTNNNLLVNENLLRRRVAHVGYLRDKRYAARPSYADLSRNRGRQTEAGEKDVTEDDDDDDYVPHRPTNYHYDEKTGKIVYHRKPEKSEEDEEEEEYEEVEVKDVPGIYLERAEGATHPTKEKVTTKPLLATATPPPEGKGLLDFVVQLKNDKSYIYIPDPTTPKPGSTLTTAASVTVDPKTTDPPEFLSILSKVKSDQTYKFVEDPKESQSKQKAVSTTPAADIEEDDDEEEESEEDSSELANDSKKRQSLADLQIFDIGDYLPTIRPIDYSKYKTIERPRNRPQPEENSSEIKVVTRRPSSGPGGEPVNADRRRLTIEEKETVSEAEGDEPKDDGKREKPSSHSTTQRILQQRRGTRPTAKITKKEDSDLKEHAVTRRTFSRYRPVSSSSRSTRGTTTRADFEEATERFSKSSPEYHGTERDSSSSNDKARRVYRRRPVRIRPTTQRQKTDDIDDDDDDEVSYKRIKRRADLSKEGSGDERLEEPTFEATYQSIKEEIVDGNGKKDDLDYIFGDEQGSESKKEIVRVKPTNVVILNKNYDKEHKHGGNYRRENEDNITEKAPGDITNLKDELESRSLDIDLKDGETATSGKELDVEIVNKNYDESKKHGGNYKHLKDARIEASQHEDGGNEEAEVQSITDNYRRTKERAGNFRINIPQEDYQKEATEQDDSKSDNVEIINEKYDKTKKHGGNYRRKNENGNDEEQAEDETREHAKVADGQTSNAKSIELINETKKPDPPKIHPDTGKKNSNSAGDTVADELLKNKESDATPGISKFSHSDEETETTEDPFEDNIHMRYYIRPKTTTTKPYAKPISRLSDVIPKPDHFYTDPQLPAQINKLGSEKVSVKLASEELDQLAVEGDVVEEIHRPQRRGVEIRRSYFDDRHSEEKLGTFTKKPLFEKDPSKRLYFYLSD